MSNLKESLKPILFFGICLLLLTSNAYSQEKNNTLKIKIEGKTYEQLSLKVILDKEQSYKVDGLSQNKQDWTFSCPDSVYKQHKYMVLFVKEPDSIVHRLGFNMLINNDTLKSGDFSFNDGSIIKLKYLRTSIWLKAPPFGFKTSITDVFFVNDPIEPQLLALAKCITSGYSMFAYDTLTNEQRFKKYIRLTKEFPYSRYAIALLSSTLTRYQSKEDVKKIFSCFNDEMQNSYFGKKISAYLIDEIFKNSVLRSWNSDVNESIVKDPSKFTLVLFSASWCAPCHAQIPILKEIYQDQSGKLDMVYVSLDESVTVNSWKKMMTDEHIPWRSLMAVDEVMRIKEKYYVEGIPLSILVSPSGHMEKIDIRHKEELDRLYKVLQ